MELLEKHFELALETPDGIKKIRELILSLAMQGKLVPQDPNDLPASELLKMTEAEKKQLSSEVKIKERGLVSPDEWVEYVYDLPKEWNWCSIRDICYDWGQKVPDKKFTYIDIGSIDNTRGIISSNVQSLNAEEAPSRARKIVKKGTVIYSTVRPYLLNVAIIEEDYKYEPIASTAFAIMHTVSCVFNRYLYYYLHSPFFVNYVQSQMKGVAYPAINDKNFFQGPFPIPPLNEQKRIVSRIDQLLALCDKLEAERNERNRKRLKVHTAAINKLLTASDKPEFKKSWNFITKNFSELYSVPENVEELKKAILQLAVMGKLVPQDPNDQPASELLKEIKIEKMRSVRKGNAKKQDLLPPNVLKEDLYELPKGWEWSQIIEISNVFAGNSFDSHDFLEKAGIRCIKITNVGVHQFIETNEYLPNNYDDKYSKYIVHEGDIIIALTRPFIKDGLKVCICPPSYNYALLNQRVAAIRPYPKMNLTYLYNYLKSSLVLDIFKNRFGNNGLQPNLKMEDITNLRIPIPPLAEQKRIVEKIDQLMGLCNALQQQINDSTKKKTDIMNGVLQKC